MIDHPMTHHRNEVMGRRTTGRIEVGFRLSRPHGFLRDPVRNLGTIRIFAVDHDPIKVCAVADIISFLVAPIPFDMIESCSKILG
jgi:hypothetical protein